MITQRIQLHPATDWWMRGARYGTWIANDRHGNRIIQLDWKSKMIWLPPDLCLDIVTGNQFEPKESN